MRAGLYFFFILLLSGCDHSSTAPAQVSLKDSVVKRYLSSIDSLDYYDTTNADYRVLKAYMNNDTGFFRSMNEEMDRRTQYIYPPDLNSCVVPKKLSDLRVDEAYRFIHMQSFCFFGQAITITKTGESVNLQYVEFLCPDQDGKAYELTLTNGEHYMNTSKYVKVKDTQRLLQLKDWENLEEKIDEADYWGLQQHNYEILLDGSRWHIDAYIKEGKYPDNKKVYSVQRQSPASIAFREIGIYLLKLSGQKTNCGEMQ